MTYATCCHPIPGDPIVGYLRQGQGLQVHQESCEHISLDKHSEHYLHVRWEAEADKEFSVALRVDVINRRGVLATMASSIAEGNSNILDVKIDERDNYHNTVTFFLTVRNRAHLARIIRRLKGLTEVTRIVRE